MSEMRAAAERHYKNQKQHPAAKYSYIKIFETLKRPLYINHLHVSYNSLIMLSL